jgi:hypothetical protein
MAANVMPITQDEPKPRAASRLCNFPTGQADLLQDHKGWIDGTVGPIITNMQGTWVDLVGYASKLGNAAANQRLSERRVEAVRNYISTWKKGINFQKEIGRGEEDSLGDETNDDGYFRAVEVYVFGFAPPPLRPRIEAKKPVRQRFAIRVVSAVSVGVGPAGADAVAFDIGEPKKGKWRRFWYTGASMNVSIKLPKAVPPISSGGSGRSVPFTTNLTTPPVELEDFEGEATLFNGPGVSLGPISVGGEMGLSIETARLKAKSAIVSPRVITMSNDTGLGLSFGGAGKGKLTLIKL